MQYATGLNWAINGLSVASQSRLASDGFKAVWGDWPQTGLRRL